MPAYSLTESARREMLADELRAIGVWHLVLPEEVAGMEDSGVPLRNPVSVAEVLRTTNNDQFHLIA
jgi:hypothetical protein